MTILYRDCIVHGRGIQALSVINSDPLYVKRETVYFREYVTADVHGYFTELLMALTEQGFFEDQQPHKLIVCGDLYDRGREPLELQAFILDLMEKDQVKNGTEILAALRMDTAGGLWYTKYVRRPGGRLFC